MEIGINLFCCGTLENASIDEQIRLMQENGFFHTFSMSDKEELTSEEIKKIQKSGITFDFLHLPFREINNLYSDFETSLPMFKIISEGIEKCARHEIPQAVLHLSAGKKPPINDVGIERFCVLMEKARSLGVKIAFENLRTLGNISLTFEKHEDAGFCWDTGHEVCFTPGKKFMPLFADRLSAVHLHDNRGIYDSDDHMIPYDGKVDFNRVAKELANAGYNGTLMAELHKTRTEAYQTMSAKDFYKRAAEALNKLKKQIAYYKNVE